MPTKLVIVPDLSLVAGRAWGVLTGEELVAAMARTRDAPDFRPHFRQLADFRGVTEFHFPNNVIRRIAASPVYALGARRAFVVDTDESFGLARMYQMSQEDPEDALRIFRDLDEALAWLDLTDARTRLLEIMAGLRPEA